jgi:hypothetical protein
MAVEKILLILKFFGGLIFLFATGFYVGYILHLKNYLNEQFPEHIERKQDRRAEP